MKKNIFRLLFTSLTTMTISTTAVLTASCKVKKIDSNVVEYTPFIKKLIDESKKRMTASIEQDIVTLDLRNLERRELLMVKDVNSTSKSSMVIGRFGEERQFYSSSTKYRDYHLATDLILPYGTPVTSLYDGEVIWAYRDFKPTTTGEGVGGMVIVKYMIKDIIDIDPEVERLAKLFNRDHIYMTIMHLSANSAISLTPEGKDSDFTAISSSSGLSSNNLISPTKPVVVKAGDRLGWVGNYVENGGWSSHIHMQFNFKRGTRYETHSTYERGVFISTSATFDPLFWTSPGYRNTGLPFTPQLDEAGKPVLDENGKQIPIKYPVLDENGNNVLDESGNQKYILETETSYLERMEKDTRSFYLDPDWFLKINKHSTKIITPELV